MAIPDLLALVNVCRYASAVILNLHETWQESEPRTPLIGLLSMGSDPTVQIETLAKRYNIECRAISMGQGQEVHARRLVTHFMQVFPNNMLILSVLLKEL